MFSNKKLATLIVLINGFVLAEFVQIGNYQFGWPFRKVKMEIDPMKAANQGECAFDEMKTEMAEIKKEIAAKNGEFEDKIGEKDRQMQEMKEENGKLGQEVQKLKEELQGMGRAMEEMEKGIAEMKEEISKLKKEIDSKNRKFHGQIVRVKEENTKLVQKAGEMKDQKTEKEAPDNLANKIDGMESKFDLIDLKENKWNSADRGSRMVISEDGSIVKHFGPNAWNCVRAQSPISKFNLNAKNPSIAYFEVENVAIHPDGIRIGFCTQQFPLENNSLGFGENSIGIGNNKGMMVDESYTNFGNGNGNFQANDVIGIGIIHYPANSTMKCFATCNGKLLGMTELPIKFADLQLFPAFNLFYADDSIRANFGSRPWRYNPISEEFTN